MKFEELESISGELFSELDLDDQQYLVGQATKTAGCVATQSPSGMDYYVDMDYDWS